jgi:membrane protease YdiL (CAAX protease family)
MSILHVILLAIVTLTTWSALPGTLPSASLASAIPAPPTAPPQPTPPTATRPVQEVPPAVSVVVGLVLIALGLVGAHFAGVFRAVSIRGPLRLEPGSRVLPIFLMLLIGGGCWIGGQVLIFAIRAAQHAHATGGQRMTIEHLGAGDMALVATVPSLVALLIVLAGDTRFGLVRAIGLYVAESQLLRVLIVGFVAGVVAMMVTYGASSLLGVFYQWIDYQHPSEHELLGAMKSASSIARALLVFGACIMAPMFEEVLFRGHMQTLLVRLFTRRHGAPIHGFPVAIPVPMNAPIGAAPGEIAAEAATMLPPPLPLPMPELEDSIADSSAVRWLAVILTSIVFALIHPLWTAPLIFLLSVCLGYAYERTGSLWVPIIMHAMFNTSSTVMFLLFV